MCKCWQTLFNFQKKQYNAGMAEGTSKFIKALNVVENFLFEPHSCICCNHECDTDNPYRLCSKCLNEIPFTKDRFCLRCGEILEGDYDYCITCKNREYEFDYARSVFAYTEFTSPMILRFKYNGYKTYAPYLAKLLADFYSKSDLVANAVTFVPMPASRKKARGYNQSRELCQEFSLLTGIPMIDVLVRIKDNTKQSTLNAKQRAENIQGSFATISKGQIKHKDILIIDDVLTTGATANECAKVLNKAGANSVCVLSLAKTPSLSSKL